MSFIQLQSENNSFNVELAIKYGVDCAIVLGHISFWIRVNAINKINFKDGKTWMYQTRKQMSDALPYFSPDQIRRITDKLCKLGVLVKGNYNRFGIDKTIWYSFADQEISTNVQTGSVCDETALALPDTKEDTKENNKEPKIKNKKDAPSAVVVFSIFDELNIPNSLKRKLSYEMDMEKANKLVKRVKAWRSRRSDGAACRYILSNWGTWEDNVDKNDLAGRNRSWASEKLKCAKDKLKEVKGKLKNNFNAAVEFYNKYLEICVDGHSYSTIIDYISANFKEKVNEAYIKYGLIDEEGCLNLT